MVVALYPRSKEQSAHPTDDIINLTDSSLPLSPDSTAPFSCISFGSFGGIRSERLQVSHTHLNERGRADHTRLPRVGHLDVVRRAAEGGTSNDHIQWSTSRFSFQCSIVLSTPPRLARNQVICGEFDGCE